MKRIPYRIIIEISILIIIIIVLFILNDEIREKNKKTFVPTKDSNKYAYQVEEIGIEGDYFVIKGWFFQLKELRNKKIDSNDTDKMGLLLVDLKSKKSDKEETHRFLEGIDFDVEYRNRYDIEEYFKCEYDYSRCGFVAKVNRSYIDLTDGDYQVVIKPAENGEEGILSNAYIHNGELCYINPNEFGTLDVGGTDLEKILDESICIGINPEYKTFLFQNNNMLYWLIDKNNYFGDGREYVRCRIDTTQTEKLPKDIIESNTFYFDFKVNNTTDLISDDINCGNYNVFARELPTEYSISYSIIAYYVNGSWKWERGFRPLYNKLLTDS